MTAETEPQSKPHFVIEPGAETELAEQLQSLEQAINEDPQALQHAVHMHGSNPGETPLDATISRALSKEGARAVEYDGVTEDAIAASGIIKQINERRQNEKNEQLSQTLAAELRKERLLHYIARVIDYQIAHPGDCAAADRSNVVQFPGPPQTSVPVSDNNVPA